MLPIKESSSKVKVVDQVSLRQHPPGILLPSSEARFEIIFFPSDQTTSLSPHQIGNIDFHGYKVQKLQNTGTWVLGNDQALANPMYPAK